MFRSFAASVARRSSTRRDAALSSKPRAILMPPCTPSLWTSTRTYLSRFIHLNLAESQPVSYQARPAQFNVSCCGRCRAQLPPQQALELAQALEQLMMPRTRMTSTWATASTGGSPAAARGRHRARLEGGEQAARHQSRHIVRPRARAARPSPRHLLRRRVWLLPVAGAPRLRLRSQRSNLLAGPHAGALRAATLFVVF